MDVSEPRDGVWELGEAGHVEVRIRRGALELLDSAGGEGWVPSIRRNEPACVEVDFVGPGEERSFEACYVGGELAVTLVRDLEPAEPGRYPVGPAGEVEVGVDDEGVASLADTAASPGWALADADGAAGDGDALAATFVREGVEWTFTARVEAGQLHVAIAGRVAGPVPPDVVG